MKRPDILTKADPLRPIQSVAILALACIALAGCQVPGTTQLPLESPYKQSLKPASSPSSAQSTSSADHSTDKAAPKLSEQAVVRGQSGSGWVSSGTTSPAEGRSPLPATDATTANRYSTPINSATNTNPAVTGMPVQYQQVAPLPAPVTQPVFPQAPANGQTYGSSLGYTQANPYADSYGQAVAPGAINGGMVYGTSPSETVIAPGAYPGADPMAGISVPNINSPMYQPRVRVAPIDVYVTEGRTGRVILGGSVNSDLGVAGQVVIDERNFDITRIPSSWDDVWNGRAFRGAGQNFRAEFMPGNRVERYTVNWTNPNLFGYLPYSFGVGGFYFTRQFRDWTEHRLGGRLSLGYAITQDLSISSELRLEDVEITDPRIAGVQELDRALGSNDIYTARMRLAHDTRDNPFLATEGSFTELVFDQVFGEYDFSRGQVNHSRYLLLRERPDGNGRHVLAATWKLGVTGSDTPIFENYYAGGYSTLRGFSFRGASPVVNDVQVGGEFMFLGSLEYVFPVTADEMLRGVAFVDYGTVEQDIDINSENFRVAPGLGVRVTVPALGPAPLAFDFAYPINNADTDDRQIFSFFMGVTR